jgi:ABC-type nitrate/sulfonate/bicarbonate transport system substrate-binding protein
MKRRELIAAAAAATCAGVLPRVARAQGLRKLRVIVFPGGGNGWPIWVGQKQGFFTREGLEVEVTPTPGSVYQMSHLLQMPAAMRVTTRETLVGDFDIAHTAMDNVVAYREGVGEAKLPGLGDFVAIMGGDNGFLHVLARPQYKAYADLHGKRLGVDALGTGFAFVLRKVLDLNGLHPGDYELVAVGAGQKRFQALVNGEIDGTISSTPFDIQGQAAGLTVFPGAIESLKHYQGYIAAVSSSWLRFNQAEASAYIRGYRNALDWLYDPAHRTEAVALLADNAKMAPAVADQVYAIMVNANGGYERHAAIDMRGVQTVIDLRKQYSAIQVPLGAPSKYVDLSYYGDAG